MKLYESARIDKTDFASIMYGDEETVFGRNLSTLSKKLWLLLHFLPTSGVKNSASGVDSSAKHIITNIPAKEISGILNCHVRTIHALFTYLAEDNLITRMSGSNKKSYDIILLRQDTKELDAKHGGTGYITLTKDLLLELLATKSRSSFQLNCSLIHQLDNASLRFPTTQQDEATHLEKYLETNVLRKVAGRHHWYGTGLKSLLTDGNLFTFEKMSSGRIIYKFNQKHHIRNVPSILSRIGKSDLEDLLKDPAWGNLKEKEKNDIYGLRGRYDTKTIAMSLHLMKTKLQKTRETVGRLGTKEVGLAQSALKTGSIHLHTQAFDEWWNIFQKRMDIENTNGIKEIGAYLRGICNHLYKEPLII